MRPGDKPGVILTTIRQKGLNANMSSKGAVAAPSPLSVPRRPAWRFAPVTTAGRQIVPALPVTEHDRALIDERLASKSHATKETDDQHDTE